MDLGIAWEPAPPELHNEGPLDGWFDYDHWYDKTSNFKAFQDMTRRGSIQGYTQQHYATPVQSSSSLLRHNQVGSQGQSLLRRLMSLIRSTEARGSTIKHNKHPSLEWGKFQTKSHLHQCRKSLISSSTRI